MKTRAFVTMLSLTATMACAQPSDSVSDTAGGSAASAPPPPDTAQAVGARAMMAPLLEMKAELKDAFQQRASGNLNGIELYSQTLARIEVTYQFLMEKFPEQPGKPTLSRQLGATGKDKQAREMFMACSLLSEAAMVQLQQARLEEEFAQINVRRDSLHAELEKVYGKISGIERSKAADLRARLDAENEKNRALREDAQKKLKAMESQLIKVRRDARGTIVSMSDLLFGFDKADVEGDLKTSLAKIAGILTVYEKCRIAVEGHTDNIGTASYNKDLSARRAKNVRDFLVSQGIGADRLSAAGYGFKRPIATNATKVGRAKNRRVDLVIIDLK